MEQTDRIKKRYWKMTGRIYRAIGAMRSAEEAFDKLKSSKDWPVMCETFGIDPTSTFTDWCA